MNELLQRLYGLIRPQDVQQAATSPLTSPQLGMLNRVLGLSTGQAQTALQRMPEQLAQSQAMLESYTPGGRLDPRLMDQFMNLATMAPMGITAFHGSPYLFRQFDPMKMGTGEGAQQYGVGAGYTAAVRDVAESYTPRDLAYEEHLLKLYKTAEKNQNWNAMEVLESAMMHKRPAQLREQFGEQAESIIKQIEKVTPKSYLYKGDIPDEILPKFLDWDKPIKEQSKEVQSLAKKYGIEMDDLGGDLVARVGKTVEGSKIMEEAGIRGIKYLDANSRNAQYGSQNFIPFRPEDYKIQEINDIPIEEYIRQGLL